MGHVVDPPPCDAEPVCELVQHPELSTQLRGERTRKVVQSARDGPEALGQHPLELSERILIEHDGVQVRSGDPGALQARPGGPQGQTLPLNDAHQGPLVPWVSRHPEPSDAVWYHSVACGTIDVRSRSSRCAVYELRSRAQSVSTAAAARSSAAW